MRDGAWMTIIVILLAIIGVMAWFLFATPAPTPAFVATSTPQTGATSSAQTGPAPLHTKVVVTTPQPNAKVGKDFNVVGSAPGGWYFEATFPIQVRDINDNVIGSIGASAQGDWTSPGQVQFTAAVHIDENYSGPATLVLLRDNPSGLPENDDSLEIPIVVQ